MGASLQGQVAVVTGASGGLGAHFARLLAAEGASVALAARRLDKIEALAGELAGQGHRAMALRLDVADAESIGPALDEVEAGLGPVSILVNNAGVGGEGPALDIALEDLDRTYAVNVRGTFVAAREAARRMLASGVAERGDGHWWPTEGGARQLKGFPRRRLMQESDLDAAFLMLVGPAARAITGTLVIVDDGQSLPGGG